jgi:hypothetical protein
MGKVLVSVTQNYVTYNQNTNKNNNDIKPIKTTTVKECYHKHRILPFDKWKLTSWEDL